MEMTGYIMPDGVVRVCFSPAYGQLYAWRLNRDEVNAFTQSVFGLSVIKEVDYTNRSPDSAQNMYQVGYTFDSKIKPYMRLV